MSRRYCREHRGWVREQDAVVVASIEAGSGAPLPAYACLPCVRDLGLVPPRRYAPSPPRGVRR